MTIDEDTSTCIMLNSCWNTMGSTTLSLPSNSPKEFNGHTLIPNRYLASDPINLSGKTVTVDIDVVDRHLNYNMLLGHSWTFPHLVKIKIK